jgi:hypothetical protein
MLISHDSGRRMPAEQELYDSINACIDFFIARLGVDEACLNRERPGIDRYNMSGPEQAAYDSTDNIIAWDLGLREDYAPSHAHEVGHWLIFACNKDPQVARAPDPEQMRTFREKRQIVKRFMSLKKMRKKKKRRRKS